MKKTLGLLIAVAFVFVLTGCEKVGSGDYKEGTYFGSVEYDSYGVTYVTTATVYVNESGVIKSVYLDSTYNSNGKLTTKKTLGDAYGMKATSASQGKIDGGAEWYEQVKVIEDKVLKEQNLDWVTWNKEDSSKLDGVSGVTISANTYVEAIEKALREAK